VKKNIELKTLVCCSEGSAEIIEKKSRFIANVKPVYTQEQAEQFIESVKKRYRDARHNCYAYITDEGRTVRFSDDGEPSKTAGTPIYNLLASKNIINTAVAVTRYFGGVLLGTGGLVRAYYSAASAGLEASLVLERHEGFLLKAESDYDYFGKLKHTALNEEVVLYDVQYAQRITALFVAGLDKKEKFIDKIINESGGNIHIISEEKSFFVKPENKPAVLYPIREKNQS
jgi:hypothetical protein